MHSPMCTHGPPLHHGAAAAGYAAPQRIPCQCEPAAPHVPMQGPATASALSGRTFSAFACFSARFDALCGGLLLLGGRRVVVLGLLALHGAARQVLDGAARLGQGAAGHDAQDVGQGDDGLRGALLRHHIHAVQALGGDEVDQLSEGGVLAGGVQARVGEHLADQLAHGLQQQAKLGDVQVAQVRHGDGANQLVGLGVGDAHGALVVHGHVVEGHQGGGVRGHGGHHGARQAQVVDGGGDTRQALLGQQANHVKLGHDVGGHPGGGALLLRARGDVDHGGGQALALDHVRGLGGVAHVDAVVHARVLNLEALAQHADQGGGVVALHPQVSLVQGRLSGLGGEEVAQAVQLLSRH
mmetsp:Transcript_12252/g.29871  ORF Transcript_12252/g.29871 Transcript_12252/m.29871 type:complete len:354 (+) Transcript_12252:363-1424(+)